MDVDGYLPLVSPLLAALCAGLLAERLPPRTATWVLTVLAAGLCLCSMVTLVALAWDGILGAMALAASAGGAVVASVRQVRSLRAAVREVRALPGDGPLAVLADDGLEAYAVPGRVVVSRGMLTALTAAERR